jgi:MFS family permease
VADVRGRVVGLAGERSFRRLLSAHAASTFGDGIAPIAVAFAVLDLSGSATDLGLVLAARTLGLVVFVLVGGVVADRISRVRVMICADLGRLVIQAATAVLLISGGARIWQLVALQAANGAAAAFFQPALTGLVSQTVHAKRLQPANAALNLVDSLGSVLGPVVAGVLVTAIGSGWAIAGDAATFAVSAAFLAGIHLPSHRPPRSAGAFAELRDGWHEVRSRQWLWVMIAAFAVFQFLILSTWQVLGPVVSDRDLGGPGTWAAVLACWGIGAASGGIVGFRLRPRRPMIACAVTLCLPAPSLALLGCEAPTAALGASAALAGCALSLGAIFWDTTLQQQVPEASVSRVIAYDWLGSTALRPVGYAVVAAVAGIASPRSILVVSAGAMVLLTACLLALPSIRGVEAGSSDGRRS